jgi:RNA polymerase sigma-70 factor (ECF subfamily)
LSRASGDLQQRFRRGEPEAVREVAGIVRRVVACRGYYVPAQERDDLVQETIVHAVRAASEPGFEARLGFAAFVRSLAHRRCVDWMRGYRSIAPLNPSLSSTEPSPERQAMARESMGAIGRALASLGYACRQLLRLRLLSGLSHREIAVRLESTEGSVRVRFHNCVKSLRAAVDALEQPSGGDG